MKIWVRALTFGIVFCTLLSACGASSDTRNEDSRTGNEDVILSELPDEVQELFAKEEILPEFPLISQFDASPTVVGPGEEVTLNGPPNLYGTVTITHGSLSESIDFSNGSGVYAVPADAPDGVYSISLKNEAGAIAFGSFRVASAPGIWLEASGKYVGAEDHIRVRITAHQVPLDMVAIFRLGDLAQEEFAEDEYNDDYESLDPFAFDGPSAYLLPAADGELVLGSLPGVPLSEIVDQTFLLPGRLANQLQVSALNAELAQYLSDGNYEALSAYDEENLPEGMEIISNTVSIQQCNLWGEVTGKLGGPGTVRAISLDGEVMTQTHYSEDGKFSLQIPPGKTIIEGWQETEEGITSFPSQTVDVPCGESVHVGFAATSSPHLASINPAISGSNLAALAGGKDEKCESIYILAPTKQPDGFMYGPDIALTHAAQLDVGLSRASVATYLDNIVWLERAAKEQHQDGSTGQEHLNYISDVLNANIVLHFQIYQLDGVYYLNVTALDVSGAKVIDNVMLTGETPQVLSKLPDAFIEKVQKAAVCASVEPADSMIGPNETVDIVIEMTDLNGEAHEQVDINLESKDPLCGSLEWTEQSIDGISVTNKYTANDELSCADTLVFVGETEGPQGKIWSNQDDGKAKITKPVLFHFNMKMVFYGEDGGAIDFNWDADFYSEDDNVIKTVLIPGDPEAASGSFTSQSIHCEVHENGVLTFRSDHLNPNATWDFELGGKMEVFENGFVEVRLIPVGTSWNLDMLPFPEECTLLLENILIWFVRTISLQPYVFVQGGTFMFGHITQPMEINFPLEGSSGFDVTITRAPIKQRQP